MRKHHILITAALVAVLAAAAYWILTDSHRPPIIARMLPDAASILYANLAPIRAATHFDQKWDFEHDAGYDDFVESTGIQPARDLNEVALSIQGSEADRRYSEVMRGKIDADRLQNWLKSHADSTEKYSGRTIYTLMHEGRPVRVCVLAKDTVAASNTVDPSNIHAILDHSSSLYQGSPDLVRHGFTEVPAASLAWWITKFDTDHSPALTVGDSVVGVPLPPGTTVVASLGYRGAIQVRATALTPSEQDAAALTQHLRALLNVAGTIASSPASPSNAKLNQLEKSITVEQLGKKTLLKADVPPKLLEDLALTRPRS